MNKNIKQDISIIATLERLIDLYPDLEVNYHSLADKIDGCNNYSEIGALIDEWLDKNPEAEDKFNAILNDDQKVEQSRFFQDIKNSKQDPETLNKEKITLLTNKMRDRSKSSAKTKNSNSSDS